MGPEVTPYPKVFTPPRSKRTRVNPVSAKTRKAWASKPAVRARVFDRDGGCLLAGEVGTDCFGPLTFHHRRKASGGGAYSEANGACLCQRHNDDIEADADVAAYARSVRLVLRPGDEEWDRCGTTDHRLKENER